MTKQPKRPRDPAQLAKFIVDVATGEAENPNVAPSAESEFARKGGLKGGRARAVSLTPERRREIAALAAKKRWGRDGG